MKVVWRRAHRTFGKGTTGGTGAPYGEHGGYGLGRELLTTTGPLTAPIARRALRRALRL